MKKSIPYGQCFVTKTPLEKFECWNSLDGSTGTIPVGTTIELCNAYDAKHSTILVKSRDALRDCMGEMGLPLNTKDDGSPPSQEVGYRFIVPNTVLGESIGVSFPKRTADLVGDILAHETGTASPRRTKRLFGRLRRTGIGSRLQGHYSSRM